MTLFEIAAIIGAITGTAGLSIMIYKTIQEKAKLSVKVKDAYHFPPMNDSYNFHEFVIGLIVNNKGTRSTTIYSSNLSFSFEGKKFETNSQQTYFIGPDSSEQINILFHIKKEDFSKNIEIDNGSLELIHTHNTENIQLQKIRKLK